MPRRHATYHRLIALLLLCAGLGGCGQKGPLFLPPGTPLPPWAQHHKAKAPGATTAPHAASAAAVPAATVAAPVTHPPRP